jgi:hypothetical protein
MGCSPIKGLSAHRQQNAVLGEGKRHKTL